MSDSVKMVFKSLLGTILFMVMTSICIELFNVNVTGMQIRHTTKMAARQAAELFTQETYKIDNGAGTIKAPTILAYDNSVYLDGDFYGGLTDKYDIYDSIYGDDSHFEDWCLMTSDSHGYDVDGANYKLKDTPRATLFDTYTNLQAMYYGVKHEYQSYLTASNMPDWDDADDSDKVKKWSLYNRAQAYYDLCYTPINLGIPYLDATIMNRMYRWNLARLMSNCNPDLIQTEEEHTYLDLYADPNLNPTDYFVNYKGFKVYADRAQITDYEYYVFDLADSDDRDRYSKLTENSVVDSSGGGTGIKINRIVGDKRIKGSEEFQEENNYVALVSITYGVPIEYIGITPLRSIFNYVWGQEVSGFNGVGGNNITDLGEVHEQWNTESQDLTGMDTSDYEIYQGGGGDSKLRDTLFTTGYLTYEIVN